MRAKIIDACILIILLAACASASQNSNSDMRLYICHYKVPCIGEGVQLCYVIKKDNGEKEFFYDDIQGFNFQWGYNYILIVEKKSSATPKADASSNTYKLKKILKKEAVLTNVAFELPVKFHDQAIIENDKGACSYFKEIEIQTGSYSCAAAAAAQSAIFRYNAGKTRLVLLKINFH